MRGLTVTPSTSPYRAEGDKLFAYAQYNDVTGNLLVGMPLYVDVTDAGEFNSVYTTTSFPASSALYNNQTCGYAVLGTNANAGANLTCIGIFAPNDTSANPKKGQVVRVLVQGRGLVALATASGATAVTVGAKIVASAAYSSAVVGAAASGKVIGTVLATGGVGAPGATITAVPGTGATLTVVNAYITLS